jgi:hypothetical protein
MFFLGGKMKEIIENDIKVANMIYEIRGVEVMLDSDLAKLYECINGTKTINQAVKRHVNKFPKRYMFQLTKNELKTICGPKMGLQISKSRTLPYAFTEQGVAMLSAVLHTEIAEQMSVKIMRAFVAMRKYLSNNILANLNYKNLLIEDHNRIDLLEQSLQELSNHQTVNSIFFAGQIFDAYIFLLDLLNKAKDEVIIIDNYAGKELFKIINDVKVKVIIVSKNIDNEMVKKYQKQYSNLEIKINNSFHDRFIILDRKTLYHSGSSFKDVGEKCFAINLIDDNGILNKILEEVNK